MSLGWAGVGWAPLCQKKESVLNKRLISLRSLIRLYLGLWINAVNYCTSCSQSSSPWSPSAQHFSSSSLASFQKVDKLRETDVPTWCSCRKTSPQILFYTISLFLWWTVLVSYAFHHSPLSLFFSNIHISAVLCLPFSSPDFQLFHDHLLIFCRVDLHIQYITEVFSIQPCCGSLVGEWLWPDWFHLFCKSTPWVFRFCSWINKLVRPEMRL